MSRDPRPALPTPASLGPLERRVLGALWDSDGATVADLLPCFPEIAYTTLMTTLERLARKNVLARTKRGRAFVYRTACTRTEFESAAARAAVDAVVARDPSSLRPLVSYLVDVAETHDPELLDELERLIRERQQRDGAAGPSDAPARDGEDAP